MPPSSQEYVSLREYFEKLITVEFRAHAEQHKLEQEAIKQARETMDLRLAKLNDLRSEVEKDRTQFMRRDIFEAEYAAVVRRLSAMENFKAGSMGAAAVLSLISGAIGAAIMKLLAG